MGRGRSHPYPRTRSSRQDLTALNLRQAGAGFGLLPHTEVEFVVEGDVVVVRKADTGSSRAREWIRRFRGSADAGMSTDELMRLTRGED